MEAMTMNWRSVAMGMVILCLLAAQFYIWSRDIERQSCIWFAGFALAVSITTIPMIIGFAGAYQIWPGLTFLPTDLTLLFGPLLFLHAKRLMAGPTPGSLYWLFLPGLSYWLYQLWAFTTLGDYRAKWAFNDAIHEPFVVPMISLAALALSGWSLWAIWRTHKRYLAWLDANRSDGAAFEPVWIKHFLMLAILAAIIWATETAIYLVFGLTYIASFWWDLSVVLTVLLLSLEALARLSQPYPKMLAPDAVSIEELVENASTERDWNEEGKRLRHEVLTHAWHLESSLTLQTLARRFGMNQTYVSRALNQGLQLSFSAFVNGLRVEHAKTMMLRDDVNLLDVALSSGFGSKASFNRAFKAHTGSTPSDYRRLKS